MGFYADLPRAVKMSRHMKTHQKNLVMFVQKWHAFKVFLCGPVTTCQKFLGFFFLSTCKPKKGSTREDFTHVHEKFTHVHEKFFGFNVHGEKKIWRRGPREFQSLGSICAKFSSLTYAYTKRINLEFLALMYTVLGYRVPLMIWSAKQTIELIW